MAKVELLTKALLAISADAERGPTSVAYQHHFVAHPGETEECGDGCDSVADPERLEALYAAAELPPIQPPDLVRFLAACSVANVSVPEARVREAIQHCSPTRVAFPLAVSYLRRTFGAKETR